MAGRKKPVQKEEPAAKKIVVNDQIDETEGSLSPEQKAAMLDSLKNIDFIPQETQDKLAAQLAQRVYEDLPEDLGGEMKKQKDELSELMAMPLSQIAKLPEDKRALVYAEMGRQLIETPGLSESVSTLVEIGKRMAEATDGEYIDALAEAGKKAINGIDGIRETISRIADAGQNLFQPLQALGTALEDARKSLAFALIGDREDAPQILAELAPYIKAEREENPDKYGETAEQPASANELIASAAARARATGLDIPPLRIEAPDAEEVLIDGTVALALIGNPSEQRPKEETPANVVKAIQKLPALNPKSYVMPNTKVMNEMQNPKIKNAVAFDVPVLNVGKPDEITTFTMIDYVPQESGVKITDIKMSEYERAVCNAVFSLHVEAEKQGVETIFSIDTVYKAMPGDGETASKLQDEEILKALEKYRWTNVKIDATEELRRRGAIGEDESVVYDEPFFQMIRVTRTSKHSKRPVIAYKLTSEPVMLKYAKMANNEIQTFSTKYLTIKKIKGNLISSEPVPMTPERQSMINYMMRRIAVMKKDLETAKDEYRRYERKRKKNETLEFKPLDSFKRQSNVILFDTLFSVTDTKTDAREQTRRNRNFCYTVLDYWVATGFVKGYKEQTKGKKVSGISIEL